MLGMFMGNHADADSARFFEAIDSLSKVPVLPAVIVMTFFAAAVYVLSMLLSMKIYGRKEL